MNKENEKIVPVFIEEEMRNSYIDYSMSVIVARALPDVRDGLKPVHRRVLFGMLDLGLRPGSAYKKSARIVGEVLGKYHPHGDSAVYDTMVRLVQDFSMRYPLVDGQGNFGSIDGDAAAAMRYTEARLAAIADQVLRDIEKDTVDFIPNFDDSLKEPSILPSLLPTLLVNGASGIAVGMATNMPPHNLTEVIDALVAVIDNPKLTATGIKKYLIGPDFPTGALIYGDQEIDSYFKTGRGKLTVRARVHIEDMHGQRQRIIVTEIPYQVNKSSLIEKIASLVRDKKLDGISEIRDESDREGMRIVFELKKDVSTEKILKGLYQHTQMQTTFGVILLALVNGEPKILSIKEILDEFLKFRHEIILRRTKFELDKAEKRAHILLGLIIALDNIDEVIAIIKKSRNVDTARSALMKKFKLSEIQAQAILDMRLQRLTGLERKKIQDEYRELVKLIKELKALLQSKTKRMQLVKKELLELKEQFGDSRKTQIISKTGKNVVKELMQEEESIIISYNTGIIKRFLLHEFKENGEKLASSNSIAESALRTANSHFLLFFSNKGNCYHLRTSFIPLASKNENGTQVEKLLHLHNNEKIINILPTSRFEEDKFIFFSTREGLVKKVSLASLAKPKEGGQTVLSLKDNDEMISAFQTNGSNDIIMATSNGMAIRFNEQDVRDMGLSAGGIKGITLSKDDSVVSVLPVLIDKSCLLTITSNGFGKKSEITEYSTIKRSGKGLVNYKMSGKVGKIISAHEVTDKDQIVLITKKQKLKKQKIKDIKLMGRATQGTIIATLAKQDSFEKTIHFSYEQIKKFK